MAVQLQPAGSISLKCYGHLVALTLAADRDRYPVTPKFHFLHHLFLTLQESSSQHAWSLNMISTSVQMDEEHQLNDYTFHISLCGNFLCEGPLFPPW